MSDQGEFNFAARDEAMDRAERGAGEWVDQALETVYQVCLKKPLIATDDIWDAGLSKPREPRAMGPVMAKAVKLGYCERLEDTRTSKHKTQHARPIRVYASRIYKPAHGQGETPYREQSSHLEGVR